MPEWKTDSFPLVFRDDEDERAKKTEEGHHFLASYELSIIGDLRATLEQFDGIRSDFSR